MINDPIEAINLLIQAIEDAYPAIAGRAIALSMQHETLVASRWLDIVKQFHKALEATRHFKRPKTNEISLVEEDP